MKATISRKRIGLIFSLCFSLFSFSYTSISEDNCNSLSNAIILTPSSVDFDAHYSNDIKSLVIVNPTNKALDGIELINILGQSVFSKQDVQQKDYIAYEVSDLSSGTCIIKIKTPQGTISKKVLVK